MKRIRIISAIVFFLIALSAFPSYVYATEASLSCTPASGTYAAGDTIVMDYVLNTRSFQALGAQIVSTYTTEVADVVGSSVTPITSVTNWSTPTTNTVDATLGKITLDYGSAQSAFTGNTAIGRVTFKAKTAGQLEVQYTFFQQYDDTTPGVAKVWGKKDGQNISNILTDVTTCLYNISQAISPTPIPTSVSESPTPIPPTSAAQTPAPTVSELPRTGTMENIVLLSVVAGGLILAGFLLPSFATIFKK